MPDNPRDLHERPFSPDEDRVCQYLFNLSGSELACHNDPIGVLISAYGYLVQERAVREQAHAKMVVAREQEFAQACVLNIRLIAALRHAIEIAGEAQQEWDKAPEGMRAGKLLIALAGGCKGYRADIDLIHELLAEAYPKGDRDG